MSSFLIQFNHDRVPAADFTEKVGNTSLYLLQLGFGKTVIVRKNAKNGFLFEEQRTSLIQRIIGIALSILLFPLNLGGLAYNLSKSRSEMVNLYQHRNKEVEIVKSSIENLESQIEPSPIEAQQSDEVELPTQKQREMLHKAELKTVIDSSLSEGKKLDRICELIPFYSETNVKPCENQVEAVQKAKNIFWEALGKHVQSSISLKEDQDLIVAKTNYLKHRDLLKFEKHKGQGIPNPEIEFPMSKVQDLQDLNLPQPGSPITEFPNYLYKFDHPRDSEEGLNPLMQMLGNREPSPTWASTLQHVEKNVLPKPIKDLSVDSFLQLIIELHGKITGQEEEIRKMFVIVSDPRKCEANGESIKQFLKDQEDGGKKLRRVERLFQKIRRWESMEIAAPYCTLKQWKALESAIYVAPSPDHLEKQAREFLEKALKMMNDNDNHYHPYQIAAFLHYGLTGLHLWSDANGRLARLITNIYLMQNGLEPFYVLNDMEYMELFNEKQYDIAFSRYLVANIPFLKTIPDEQEGDIQCAQQ